jgi:hypothetical protein
VKTTRFPIVEGQNLLRRTFRVPTDFGADLNVALLCFTMQQQLDVNTWLPFLKNLKRRCASLEVYEFPTLPRYPWVQRRLLDHWMRQGIPDPNTRAATTTLYLDLNSFAHDLELPDLNSIYTLLIAQDGRVLHREVGAFSPEKAARLEHQALDFVR